MIMTQEQQILKAQEQFAQIEDFIREACSMGRRMDEVESDLWGQMLQLGRCLLEGYVAGYQQGDMGPTLERDGRSLRRLDQAHDWYSSVSPEGCFIGPPDDPFREPSIKRGNPIAAEDTDQHELFHAASPKGHVSLPRDEIQ
jgi:hypothetical protein